MLLKNITTRFICLFMIGGIFVSVTSCSSKDEQVLPEKGAVLNVGVKGIEEVIVENPSKQGSINTSGKEKSSTLGHPIVSLGDVDALIDFEQGSALQTPTISNNVPTIADTETAKAATGGLRAATASLMDIGVKFRLLIYDNTNTQIFNQVATSGTNPQIQLVAYKKYTWYAVSLNEKNGTVPTMGSNGVIARAGLENKDVLYASGSFDALDGPNYLDIIFKRMTARIQVKLNVRGLFGTIENNTSVTLVKNSTNTTVLKMGDFNVLTGQFAQVVDVNKAVLGPEMIAESGNPAGTVKVANFYTLNTDAINANNFKIKFNTLKINLDDSRVRTFAPPLYTYPGAYTPTIGSTYALNIRLIESPVKVKGVLWARSNLIYNSSHTDSYRLKSNPGGSTSATRDTEFWNWKSSTPNSATSNVDPCVSVYPAGTWRMSTKAEWESIGQPDDKQEVLGLFWGAQYAYVWQRDSDNPANAAYDDNNLVLSFGGYRTTGGTVTGSPGGIALGAFASGECHYWTSDNANSTTAYAVRSSFTRVAWLFSWGNVTYPNLNKSEGRNIRCVRQIVNN